MHKFHNPTLLKQLQDSALSTTRPTNQALALPVADPLALWISELRHANNANR